MCECSKVHLFEVEFKLDGKQADKFQKELVKSWGFEQEDD
jgi:hypothetical protein